MYNSGLYSRYSTEYREHKQRQKAVAQNKKYLKAIALNKSPNFQYFKQETCYTCGPACIRMVLGSFGIDKTEKEICDAVKPITPEYGTPLKQLVSIKDIYNLECQYGNNGSINQLSEWTADGWICVVHYSLPDVSHYSLFLYDNDCGHILLNDPWFGPHFAWKKAKFLKKWKVQQADFPNFKCHSPDTFRWYAAFRKKENIQKRTVIHHKFDSFHHYMDGIAND
eukprot:72360_1